MTYSPWAAVPCTVHDLDFPDLFSSRRSPGADFANIPPPGSAATTLVEASLLGDGSVLIPGSMSRCPDGRHVWEYAPRGEVDLGDLVKTLRRRFFRAPS